MFWLFENPAENALERLVEELFGSKPELLLEDSGVIKHLTHLEDLVLDGKERFTNTIKSLLKIAHQHEGADDTLVVEKIDGAPAVFFLVDPRTDSFGVSTKSIGGKTQKIAHSSKEIRNLFDKPGLQVKLDAALMYLKELNLEGYGFQGDVLFTKEDVRKQRIKGKDYLTFQPNVLMYAVAIDANSELYKKVASSEFGLVVHTIYKIENNEEGLKLTQVRSPKVVYDLVKQAENIQGLFMTHPFHPQIKLEVSEEDVKNVETLLANLEKTNYKNPTVKTREYFAQFINDQIRKGEMSANAKGMANDFLDFLESRKQIELEKRKTPKGQASVAANFQAISDEIESAPFGNFLKVYILALQIKKVFLGIFSHVQSKIGTTFFDKQETGPEGFILAADSGIVKLVDRNVFSRQNFLFGAFNKPKE